MRLSSPAPVRSFSEITFNLMEITENNIKLIIKLISEKLGPDASPEKVRSLTTEAIRQLSNLPEAKPIDGISMAPMEPRRLHLIINAFGISESILNDDIQSFLAGKNLTLITLSSTKIEHYTSLIAIVDYSDSTADLNRLKFELSELCEKSGHKVIIQDSSYYGLSP
jgi:predicted amino acid-binding ACT domain protein